MGAPNIESIMNKDLRTTLTAISAAMAATGRHRRGGQDAALNQFFTDLLAQTPEDEKKTCDFYEEAWAAAKSGDRKKMRQLCEVRKIVINNYISASAQWAEWFFDTVTLGESDQAQFTNETNQEVSIGYLAQDGRPRMQRAIQAYDNFLVPLKYVSSDKFGYQIEDIQRGRIDGAAKASVNIGFDLNFKLDRNCFNLMTAALGSGGTFGDFVTTGPERGRTYKAHSGIVTANLPTSNDITLDGIDTTSKFTLSVPRKIIHYCDSWANVFKEGPLRPTGMIVVASSDSDGLLDQLQATAAKPSAIAEGLLSNYTQFEFGGIVWTVVPNATIEPGVCYAPLSRAVGTQFLKPALDKESVDTDEDANWEDRGMKKVQGLYTPVQRRVNGLRIRYRQDS